MAAPRGREDITLHVWHGLIGSAYHRRYLRRVSERSRLAHQLLMLGIAAGAAIIGTDLVINYAPDSLTAAVAAVVTVATVLELTFRPAVTAAEAAAASRQYGLLANEWDQLWWNQASPGVRESIRRLTQQMYAVQIPESFFATRTLRKSYKEALADVQAAYASS